MTKAKISQYDAVAGNNTDVNGVNIAEGCPPSSMNNMGREIMAALKRYQVGSDGDGVTVGGNLVVSGSTTANTLTATVLNATTIDTTNIEVTNIKAKDGTAAVQIADSTGVVSVTAAPVLTALTASQAVFTNASKALVSNAITGSGNVVMSTSPTLVTPVLGTPSSGTVTNLTGTASININGTVGATTPATGSFTTLAASSTATFAAGAVGTPSLTTSGDTNTGIFFPAADNIGFATNGVIRGRWTTDGLCFGTDTAAANALDDYEEGTWTPAFDTATAGSGRGTQVFSATYTKIGRLVTFYAFSRMDTLGTGGSGGWAIRGLPFTSLAGGGDGYASISVGYFNELNSNVTFITGIVIPSSTEMSMRGTTAAAASITDLSFSTFVKVNTSIIISGQYYV